MERLDADQLADLRRGATRAMARQAVPGMLLVPVASLVVALGAGLHRQHPRAFFLLMAAIALLTAARVYLLLRFDELYARSSRSWRLRYCMALIATVLVWATLSCWILVKHELSGIALVALLMSAVACHMALLVYPSDLLLVRLFLLTLIVPHIATGLYLGGVPRLVVVPATVAYGLYLWISSRRLYRQTWERLVNTRKLELREAELLGHRERLEDLVEERTRRLADAIAELEANNAELEDRNAEMERFIYSLSHDLKSPLVTIRGFLGMLEVDVAADSAERIRSDLERIDAAARRMAQLLDELLEMSRIGRIIHPPEVVSLESLVEEAVERVSGFLGGRAVDIEVLPDPPPLWGDRARLQEVLYNLIDNAVRFSPEQEEPRIEIGARHEGGETVCYVRDHGIGIDPRYHERIFDLFEKLDPQRTDSTGIGLSMVRRIVEVHCGRTWVESNGPGHGSTFFFTLPRPEAAAAGSRREDSAVS